MLLSGTVEILMYSGTLKHYYLSFSALMCITMLLMYTYVFLLYTHVFLLYTCVFLLYSRKNLKWWIYLWRTIFEVTSAPFLKSVAHPIHGARMVRAPQTLSVAHVKGCATVIPAIRGIRLRAPRIKITNGLIAVAHAWCATKPKKCAPQIGIFLVVSRCFFHGWLASLIAIYDITKQVG
jgi:hypothetical protein